MSLASQQRAYKIYTHLDASHWALTPQERSFSKTFWQMWSRSVCKQMNSAVDCVTAPCNEKCLRCLFSEHLGTLQLCLNDKFLLWGKFLGCLFVVQRQSLLTHALVNFTRRIYSKQAFSIMLKWSKQTKPFEMTSSVKSARAGECCLPGHALVENNGAHTEFKV